MSVNGLSFIIFLFATLLVYYIVPKKIRWTVLFVASVGFYLTYSIKAAVYMLFTVIFTYVFSLILGKLASIQPIGETPELKKAFKKRLTFKKRVVLSIALILNFLTLAVLKYSGFFIANLNNILEKTGLTSITAPSFLLPLGISFYIFQTSGYLIDIYRGKYSPQKNIIKYATFVCYFPQIVQGPINRYNLMSDSLYNGNKFEVTNIQHGLLRMIFGILKKALVADSLALAVSEIYKNYTNYPGVMVFIGSALYCIQLYCDFSGGIDLLCGASQLFGIKMQSNFEQPYFATSLADFWRRWHISLGEWMKDYLFYPIALSKALSKFTKKMRKIVSVSFAKRLTPCIATFIVFVVVGIWQGPGWANIAYGLWNGFWMSLALIWVPVSNKIYSKIPIKQKGKIMTVIGILRTNFLVIIGRYFSNSASLGAAVGMLKQTFLFPQFDKFNLQIFENLGFTPAAAIKIVVALIAIFCISLAKEKKVDVVEWFCNRKWFVQFLVIFICLFIIVFTVYANKNYTPIAYVYENV